jgi:hypothetical protein
VKEQFNVRLDAGLARLVKEAAQEQGRTVGGIVALALEAWLSKASSDVAGDSSGPAQQSAFAALEARVAKLEAANKGSDTTFKNNDKNQDYYSNVDRSQSTTQGCDNITPTQGGSKTISSQEGVTIVAPSQGLTTVELAKQTGTNKGAWNNWASKASPGDIRHHPQAGSWRLVGKAPAASGGPERWLWEPA